MNRLTLRLGGLGLALLATSARAELTFPPAWPEFTFNPTPLPVSPGVAHSGGTVYVTGGNKLFALNMENGLELGQTTVGPGCDTGIQPAAITSVAAYTYVQENKALVAVAVANAVHTNSGRVLLYDALAVNSGNASCLAAITVGANPDMLTFTPDGSKILVANEGEPNPDYTEDPEGSISVISAPFVGGNVKTLKFTGFNGQKQQLIEKGVRIFGPNATVAKDLEPEHIAVADNGKRAWVTLQENNALAVLELSDNPTISAILPLRFKDHGQLALDVSDKDKAKGNLQTYQHLFGMYQPDGIVAGKIGDKTYLFTANEGDAREYLGVPGFSEEARVGTPNPAIVVCNPDSPILAPFLPLNPALTEENDALCRLRVTTTLGSFGGVYNELYSFGTRSFSVWDPDGVWDPVQNKAYDSDSDSTLEALLAKHSPQNLFDSRSDDKGPEPEDLVLGEVGGTPYLFVGLERANGVMAFDVSDPANPRYAGFATTPSVLVDGDRPERLDFVPASASATGHALLLVTNEASGKIRAYNVCLTACPPGPG